MCSMLSSLGSFWIRSLLGVQCASSNITVTAVSVNTTTKPAVSPTPQASTNPAPMSSMGTTRTTAAPNTPAGVASTAAGESATLVSPHTQATAASQVPPTTAAPTTPTAGEWTNVFTTIFPTQRTHIGVPLLSSYTSSPPTKLTTYDFWTGPLHWRNSNTGQPNT